MMMKYRVSEVAKDFNVPSKEIIELLAKYIDTPKKSMTALEESELDLIFEHYTQKYQTENFDAYYATAKEKKEEPAPAASEAAATAAPAKSIAQMPGKITPARPASAAGQPARPAAPKAPAPPKAPVERRTIDTRTPQVNVGKYDEKFDNLAQASKQVRGDGGAV